MMTRVAVAVMAILLAASTAQAQSGAHCTGASTGTTVQASANPRVQFQKSADHDAQVTGSTTWVLTGYVVMVCTGSTMTTQANVAKPTPDASGNIIVPVPNASLLAKNTQYYTRVYAVGPGGTSAPSVASSPFVMAGAPAAPGAPTILP
jgi:hypothetical protein